MEDKLLSVFANWLDQLNVCSVINPAMFKWCSYDDDYNRGHDDDDKDEARQVLKSLKVKNRQKPYIPLGSVTATVREHQHWPLTNPANHPSSNNKNNNSNKYIKLRLKKKLAIWFQPILMLYIQHTYAKWFCCWWEHIMLDSFENFC